MDRVGRSVVIAAALAWLTTMAVAAQQNSGKTLKNPFAATPESIAAGKGLYAKNCAECHGTDLKGNGPKSPPGTSPPSLIDDEWKHGSTDGEIFTTIHDGVGPTFDMDLFEGKISDKGIWDIVNYIRSAAPKSGKTP